MKRGKNRFSKYNTLLAPSHDTASGQAPKNNGNFIQVFPNEDFRGDYQ